MVFENPFSKKNNPPSPPDKYNQLGTSFDILKKPLTRFKKDFGADISTDLMDKDPEEKPTIDSEEKEIAKTRPELQQYLLQAAEIARKQHPEIFTKGKCEQSVRLVMSRAIELAKGLPLGSTDKMRIRWTQIDKEGTSILRGKRIKDLTETDLQKLKPGSSIYMASKNIYSNHGVKITPGTSDKLKVIPESARHWVMWDGVGFTDNWGTRRTLSQLKSLVGGQNRVIINIHDPFGDYGVA